MDNIKKPHYIFKLSSGKILDFHHAESGGLGVRVLNKSGIWLSPMLIEENISHGFSSYLDTKDKVHILFQDRRGNLKYTMYGSKNWKTMILLSSKKPIACEKHLHVKGFKDRMYFFYVLEHDGNRLLSFQSCENGAISLPRVIDYIDGDSGLYGVLEANGSLFVFYRYAFGNRNQVGYKRYLAENDAWSEFITLSDLNMDASNEYRAVTGDSSGGAHLCWQKHSPDNYELVHKYGDPSASEWSGEHIIFRSERPVEYISLICMGPALVAYWYEDNNIFFTLSENKGKSWRAPMPYKPAFDERPLEIAYSSNRSSEYAGMYWQALPGSLAKGIKLFFADNPPLPYRERDSAGAAPVPGGRAGDIPLKDGYELLQAVNKKLDRLEAGVEELKSHVLLCSSDLEEVKARLSELYPNEKAVFRK